MRSVAETWPAVRVPAEPGWPAVIVTLLVGVFGFGPARTRDVGSAVKSLRPVNWTSPVPRPPESALRVTPGLIWMKGALAVRPSVAVTSLPKTILPLPDWSRSMAPPLAIVPRIRMSPAARPLSPGLPWIEMLCAAKTFPAVVRSPPCPAIP